MYIYDVAIISPRSDRSSSCPVNDLFHAERDFSMQQEVADDKRQQLCIIFVRCMFMI